MRSVGNIVVNNNIGVNGSSLRYVNKSILIHDVNLQSFLEVSDDINLSPINLSNLNAWEVIETNNSFLRDARSTVFWCTEFVIQLNNDGEFVKIDSLADYKFFSFYERLDEVINNRNEANRQINNIIRDRGQGLRRIRDI